METSHSCDSTDRCLLDQIRTGHAPALNALLNRHWASLVTYAARMAQGWDAAEDIAQETFVRIWERRETWSPEGSVRALLYKIARNLALDAQKYRRRRADWAYQRKDVGSVPTPYDELQANELEAAFEQAVTALPERRREIFLLARVDGLSYQQIAEVLGIAPQTVANQMSSVLSTLRVLLKEYLDEAVLAPNLGTRSDSQTGAPEEPLHRAMFSW